MKAKDREIKRKMRANEIEWITDNEKKTRSRMNE